jgi:hypothetical protein
MTDRIKSLTVVLEPNVRDDDCRVIMEAISQLRRVQEVACNVADFEHYEAVSTANHEWRMTLYDFLHAMGDREKRHKLKKLLDELRCEE